MRLGIDRARWAMRRATWRKRVLPDFIILGQARAGSTGFYAHLVQHPLVRSAWSKEIHYFSRNYGRGIEWYRAFFPLRWTMKRMQSRSGQKPATGEASPSYMMHPGAPRRVWETVPEVRLIMLLRNPTERAISHYWHKRDPSRWGYDPLSFEEALDAEEERLAAEEKRLLAEPFQAGRAYNYLAYKRKGIYVDQIKMWRLYFRKDQILIIRSEDFFSNPKEVFERTSKFLGLPVWAPENLERINIGGYPDPGEKIRKKLDDYFRPHNRRLFEYLGVEWDWPT